MWFRNILLVISLLFLQGRTLSQDGKGCDYPQTPAPILEMELESAEGGRFKLGHLKGKVTLINLWATWCGPCRGQIAFLTPLQEKYRKDGLEVVGVNVGDGEGQSEPVRNIKLFGNIVGFNYVVTTTSEALTKGIFELTGKSGVPMTIMLNRQGKIRGTFFGAGERVNETIELSLVKALSES